MSPQLDPTPLHLPFPLSDFQPSLITADDDLVDLDVVRTFVLDTARPLRVAEGGGSPIIRRLMRPLMAHQMWKVERMLGIAAASWGPPRLRTVLMACGLSCVVAGCGPESQVIELGYESLPRCDVQSEIRVEE